MSDLNSTYAATGDPSTQELVWGWFGQSDDSRRASIETKLAEGRDLGWLFDVLNGAGDSALAVIGAAGGVVNASVTPVTLASVSVDANSRYTFEGFVIVGSNATADARIGLNAPAGSTVDFALSDGSSVSTWSSFPDTATVSTGTSKQLIQFVGEISVGSTAGTVSLVGAQGTSTAFDKTFAPGRLTVSEVG